MEIEIDGGFHEYCVDCPYMRVGIQSCENYRLCARLFERLSTIRSDPPDLMPMIAEICREKGTTAEEVAQILATI